MRPLAEPGACPGARAHSKENQKEAPACKGYDFGYAIGCASVRRG